MIYIDKNGAKHIAINDEYAKRFEKLGYKKESDKKKKKKEIEEEVV